MTKNKVYPIKALEIADFNRQAEMLRERSIVQEPHVHHLQASSVHFQPKSKRLTAYTHAEEKKEQGSCWPCGKKKA